MGNIDDQHRNTNMNDKDHLVGQLTTKTGAYLGISLSPTILTFWEKLLYGHNSQKKVFLVDQIYSTKKQLFFSTEEKTPSCHNNFGVM